MLSIHELLEVAIKQKASDLVVKAGAVPAIRVDGQMQLTSLPVITPEQTRELAFEIMFSASRDTLLQYPDSRGCGVDLEDTEAWMRELEQKQELDIVFTIPQVARVRANLPPTEWAPTRPPRMRVIGPAPRACAVHCRRRLVPAS